MTAQATLRSEAELIVPGLINMHDHLRSFLAPTRAGDTAPLADVITRAAAVQAVADPQDYYDLTALAAARQLLAGATTVVDHVYPLHHEGLLEAVIEAHAAVGLRGIVAVGVLTRGAPSLATTIEQAVTLAAQAKALLPAGAVYLAPVSLRQNQPEDYRRCVAAAADLDIGLYTHIAENQAEVDGCLAEHGRRPVELLAEAGFLGPRTILVHAICLSDNEITLLAASGTNVVYCPTNHAKLAKPIAPVAALLAAGVRVTLGVDGMESLWHEMRQTIAVQGQACGRPGVVSTDQALAMATSASRSALIDGGLAPDFDTADAVRVDLSGATTQPLADLDWALVHRVGPREVIDVTVAGRAVIRGSRLVTADLQDLVRTAREATSRITHRSGRLTPPVPPVGVDK